MSAAPAIPIQNIYFLFCYAWGRFEEAKSIPLSGMESPDLPNLLARVLLHGTRSLLRRGLDRNYQPVVDDIATVRGRIDLSQTARLHARSVRRLVCEFDELSHDLLHNQILKASLKRLAKAPTINSTLARELQLTAQRMGGVSDIWLARSAFARVQLYRTNAYYDLVLKAAELAFDCLLPDPATGALAFHDVMRDEGKMAKVFEEFVRNFYRIEQKDFSVEPLQIAWDAVPIATSGAGRLPAMIVDVYLKSPMRKLIIDTKYYAKALQKSMHGSESFHSGNFYQVFSYLKNAAGRDPDFVGCEGMLLYPQVHQSMHELYQIQGHQFTVATVDLAVPWPEIHRRLLEIIAPHPAVCALFGIPGH